MTPEGWLGGPEPVWHYELAEVVYALLDHDGELPILATHSAFPAPQRPDDDVEVAFEIEIFDPAGVKSESDIAVRDGSRLWLGEATTKNRLDDAKSEQERLSRLSIITGLLAAHGVLLASSTKFRPASVGRARAAFAGPWPVLRLEEDVVTRPPAADGGHVPTEAK
jgi:hypothetical protein